MAIDSSLLKAVRANAEAIALMNTVATAELERSNAIAEKTERSKFRFLAGVGHELRTPLNAIIGFSDMILEGHCGLIASARQGEYLELIRTSARHLGHVVDSMLDAVQGEFGRAAVNLTGIDLAVFTGQCASFLQSAAQQRGVTIEAALETANGTLVRQDPDRLRQVVLNLLRNAVEHAPPGTAVRLSAGIVIAEDGGRMVRIAVADQGPGLSSEHRLGLFKPFSRLDDPLTRSRNGLGLGLAICKSLVELLGGRIDCVSEPGQRTEFWLEVPDRSE